MPAVGFQVVDPLGHREDEHHHDDGHGSESLEGKRHTILFYCRELSGSLLRQDTTQFV